MSPGIAATAVTSHETETLSTLLSLATLRDPNAHAISYYCSSEPFPDKTHTHKLTTLDHLLRRVTTDGPTGPDYLTFTNDLTHVVTLGEKTSLNSPRFRAIFACGSQDIWQEVTLPALVSECSLEIDRFFRLAPLLRAIQSCEPHCLVLTEHGKARILMVRGQEIEEIETPLPPIDFRPKSVPGFSHHIEGNLRERSKAFIHDLIVKIQHVMQEHNCKHLVIGCRKDLWSELSPQFHKAKLSAMIAGHFHLPSFEISRGEALSESHAVMAKDRERFYKTFWEKVQEEPRQFALGVNSVLNHLESGRVLQLLLGNLVEAHVSECADCQAWAIEERTLCSTCGGARVARVPAEELILRKALSTDVEIFAPEQATAKQFGQVAALLRY